jgi:hypothetical protein
MDGGGWTWLLLDIVGVLALGAILAYGILVTHRRRRNGALERQRDAVTKEVYKERSQDRVAGP